ncbi:F22G5.33 [Arabidopsis lyrata subsp. lyrata]|uniref:F22G5.33 n=1 Tax=Arabidopsis lyrata subsp. lyrata TaxID=81972 RepID=D7KH12_ARALL|nr:F22G5.33 [Arabidopsis lyrata subsp. lyrata]
MRIDAKDVGTLFWKILRFSTNIVYTNRSEEEETRKADLKHQRSVRRNARRKVEEVGKDWDSSQASEDERDKVILTTLYGEIPNTDKSPKLEKPKKDRAFLVAEDFSFEPSLDEETLSTTGNVDPSERLTSGGGETEIESSSSSEGEEEEIIHEDKKVLVAWTEDDQKNLMDLGNSEMERNKRLEHLITRRKMRRLVRLAAESSLMDMEVPSICVGRNYFGLHQENYIVDGLQMPESAPSVLLPTKNPFDIPYDPQEEKPNLSGDSFQQEFAANPNDIFFCRHESFCRRVFPLENQLDTKWEPWKKSIDGLSRPQQGCNDGLVGDKHPIMKGKDLTRGEVNDMESEHMTEIVVSDSNSLLSPVERETDSNVSNQADSSGTSGKPNGDLRIENPLVGLVPRNTGSLSTSLAAERQRYVEHFGYSSRKGHKLSAESDLQVEFSEIGSPPTTVDGNNSSDEEKSLFVYESETGKETRFSGEENEVKQKSIVDRTAETQMLPVEKVGQVFDEKSSTISPETYEAKQFEGLSDGTNVSERSEEEDSSKSGHFPLETVPHINEVIPRREEESLELVQNSTDEMKINDDSDEPEPLTNQESEEHFGGNDGDQSTQEMQELIEPEVSNVNNVTSDESATSPRSVLPDMLLPLDQTYTLNSESLEHTLDSQPQLVIPYPESPHNQSGGVDGDSR